MPGLLPGTSPNYSAERVKFWLASWCTMHQLAISGQILPCTRSAVARYLAILVCARLKLVNRAVLGVLLPKKAVCFMEVLAICNVCGMAGSGDLQ